MKRDFKEWLNQFRVSISNYTYYVDFVKVYNNVDNIKVELNILNSLVGSKNIKTDFVDLLKKYPETIKCIPILLAVRGNEIRVNDNNQDINFVFNKSLDINVLSEFMEKSGLFELISNRIINNLVDYVLGVEVGLDSNGRKNRGGHLMEDMVEKHLINVGLKKDVSYFKEMYLEHSNFNLCSNSSPQNFCSKCPRIHFVRADPQGSFVEVGKTHLSTAVFQKQN